MIEISQEEYEELQLYKEMMQLKKKKSKKEIREYDKYKFLKGFVKWATQSYGKAFDKILLEYEEREEKTI